MDLFKANQKDLANNDPVAYQRLRKAVNDRLAELEKA
jgi:hypothetical protein